ncbi:MAG: outer membrane protein assembly factor BamA [Opitutales bacterium]
MRYFRAIDSCLILVIGCLLLLAPVHLRAQVNATNAEIIQSVRIEFDGFRSASDSFIRNNIQIRKGMPLNAVLIDQSIRALYNSGQFEFVEVDVLDNSAGGVDVLFKLVGKYTIERIDFSGNNAFSKKRLLDKVEMEVGDSLDEYALNLAADAIVEYYIEKGYPDAQASYSIERSPSQGQAIVGFVVDEGQKALIKRIYFSGNETVASDDLRSELELKKRGFWSWLSGSGKLDPVELTADAERLRAYYRDLGYLDVELKSEDIAIEKVDDERIEIHFKVHEGERYHLGEVSIKGAQLFSEATLREGLKLRVGDYFSPTAVDAAVADLRAFFTSRGYLETRVGVQRQPNTTTGRIDVVFTVKESEKFYVESINVEGNTKTKAKVIVRELALKPGDVFDLKRMEVSEARLRNTSFFEEVRLEPQPTAIPGRKDLGISLREGRTGSFTFGAGFGSVEKATVFFEMAQGNFDLFNWGSGLQGDGQKFRFRASLGSVSNQLTIAFEEPWLFEQRLAFGTEIFRSESEYNSSDYNELRTGFELYLRRRLFELVEGRLSYRLEQVEIMDVEHPNGGSGVVSNDGVADVFQAAEGEELVSKFGLTLLRDNRDSLLFTRKGNRTSIENEFAGLGGDVNYFKSELRTAHFIPTHDYLEQTLSIVGRLGAAVPFGQSEQMPFYDRFYLGGPETLRGYDYRDIGPRDPDDSNESIGGNTYGLLSFEYGFRLADPLGLVAFYDAGFVNSGDYDFSLSDYADNWGIGARIMIMGSPLKLDLGIPITAPNGLGGGTQFNFSFGTRF